MTILVLFFAVFLLAVFFLNENRRLRKESKTLQTDVRTMLHEIKNSLTAMKIESENLPAESLLNGEIDRLSDLSNAFGEYLKDSVGKPETVELNSFLDNLCTRYGKLINICKSDDVYVLFDKNRLRSVFENLLKNAVESMVGESLPVDVEVAANKRFVTVKVMDRGVGLQTDNPSELFRAFYTTKDGGNGIGLYIAKKYTEAQKGSISLYSRDGGGTVAQVILPIMKVSKGDKNE